MVTLRLLRWPDVEAISKVPNRIRRDTGQLIKVSAGKCSRAAWWHYGPVVYWVLVEELPGIIYNYENESTRWEWAVKTEYSLTTKGVEARWEYCLEKLRETFRCDFCYQPQVDMDPSCGA